MNTAAYRSTQRTEIIYDSYVILSDTSYWIYGSLFQTEWPPGRHDISRIIGHISSPPQDTPVQEVFSDYLLDINWLFPVDLAVVPLHRPPKNI